MNREEQVQEDLLVDLGVARVETIASVQLNAPDGPTGFLIHGGIADEEARLRSRVLSLWLQAIVTHFRSRSFSLTFVSGRVMLLALGFDRYSASRKVWRQRSVPRSRRLEHG